MLSPAFIENTTAYTVEVAYDTSSITVTLTTASGNATITVNDNSVASGEASNSITLEYGENTITIRVTAEDNITTKDYYITVIRAYPTYSVLNKRISGIWRLTSGTYLSGEDVSDLQYIQFEENGMSLIVYRTAITEILGNIDSLYAVLNDTTVLLDIFGYSMMRGMGDTYIFDKPDESTLTLTDSSQNTITFTAETQIPEAFLCKEFNIQAEYKDLEIEPDTNTNLVWDGLTYLWYKDEDSNTIYPFDTSTETLLTGSGKDFGTYYSHIHAYQGGDFWTHCHCGGNEDASLRTTAGVEVDNVDTDADLGHEINIDAIAWDGTHLWLYGYSYDLAKDQLLKVDSNAEPDSLEDSYDFDRIDVLTWDGSNFWALSGYGATAVIVKIDPIELKAIATYKTPHSNIRWMGIATVGSDLYLLGRDNTKEYKGVITHVTPN